MHDFIETKYLFKVLKLTAESLSGDSAGTGELIVYDILGKEVIRLVNNELKQPGRYTVEFNGTNLASGVYFFRLEARQAGSTTGDYVKARKMVLVK